MLRFVKPKSVIRKSKIRPLRRLLFKKHVLYEVENYEKNTYITILYITHYRNGELSIATKAVFTTKEER